MLRNRRKTVIGAVKELDAFPKVPASYVETSASGGTISVITFILMGIFIVSEIIYYSSARMKFKYMVDTDYDSKLKINIDMTVAMPCDTVGADILDVTNQNADKFGQLNEEPTWFDLSPKQQVHWDSMKHINYYLREEYHSIQSLLWSQGYTSLFGNLPSREVRPNTVPDSCRFYGTLTVNKVSGNFHITAGKSIPFPRGHAHLAAFLSPSDYNFTHRIERLSFGDPAPGIVNPLDAEEKVTKENYQLYQYYLQIVQTDVHTSRFRGKTYQYSTTEQERQIDHSQGSHGVPGIYFKYDMSSIKIGVTEDHTPFWMFLVRICGIVGGIYSTSGIICAMVEYVVCLAFCRESRMSNAATTTPPRGNSVHSASPVIASPGSTPSFSSSSSPSGSSPFSSSSPLLLSPTPSSGDHNNHSYHSSPIPVKDLSNLSMDA